MAAGLLLLASCKGKNKTGLYIPKDAAVAFHISPKSLSSKLSWEDIKKTTWFKDAYAESHDSLAQKILNDPEASGLDMNSDLGFFLKKRGKGGFGMFEGSVKDEAAFAALVKKMDAAAKVEKDGDWNVIKNGGNVLLWNSSKFATVSDMPMDAFNPMDRGERTRFSADSLKIFGKQIMAGEGESLFDDDRFASVMKEDGDMHFWMNTSEFYSGMSPMLSMMKAGSLLEGNATGGTISFEDGKIATRMKSFYGKEMQKLMEKWNFKKLDAAVLNRIPSDNVIGVFALNMDPAGLKEVLKATGMDGMANMFLSKQGLSLDELVGATKGQFVMALSDLQMKDTTITYGEGSQAASFTSSRPDMSFLFATDVAQKATFDKLMTLAKTETPELPFNYQLDNNWFVAGNKPTAVAAFAAGNTTKHAFTDKLSGTYCGFYLDLQRLLKTNFTKDPFGKTMLDESAAIWKDVLMVAHDYKDGVSTADMTINLVDGKTNALKQINQYIEKMNAAKKANRVAMEEQMQNMPADTSVTVEIVPPPPAAADAPKQ